MTVPVVLFACVHNTGRSVAARLLTEHYARGKVDTRVESLVASLVRSGENE